MIFHEVIIIPNSLDFLPLGRAPACLLQNLFVFINNCKVFLSVHFIFLIIPVSEEPVTSYLIVCVFIFSSLREI